MHCKHLTVDFCTKTSISRKELTVLYWP